MLSFTVIIPNYNHAAYLEQRINSVLQQTYPRLELIILDDGSADNSHEIIEKYRGHEKISHIVYTKENSGSPFLQWKKGIELAKNEWIWIAESDDYADPLFLDEAAGYLSRFPTAGIFYCDSFVVNEEGQDIEEKFSQKKNTIFCTTKWNSAYFIKGTDETDRYLKFDCTINNISCVVFRKTLFPGVINGLSGFRYYGDWFFLLKASAETDICYTPAPLNYYRKHGSSYLNSEISLIISRKEYFQILHWLYYNNQVTEKQKLLDHFSYHYLSFGLNKDGIKKSRQILKTYLNIDKALAWKVIKRIFLIKIFRQKRPFFVSVKQN